MNTFFHDALAWMTSQPGPRATAPIATPAQQEAILTGPELIGRIVRAIELDQSVLLTGPRGCGKSWCVRKAIEKAQELGIIPPQASVFLQGNREIPRDYLAEDEIAFRTDQTGGKLEVIPDLRSAPLFRFARRDPASRGIVFKDRQQTDIEWDLSAGNGSTPRFVLFLDEINRFSDGVLDSLLSLLEERTAVLGGREVRVPAVVCMTMNPPGYDGSARRLSPPLAARIGRSFRLATPDLDTLSDVILPERLKRAREMHESTRPTRFPKVAPDLLRRASLVTLCLWGDLSLKKTGSEYLTSETHELLHWALGADVEVKQAMKDVGELCQFGPDGRAVGDWTIASIGAALQEAETTGAREVIVEERHFLDTVVESVAHKIYDNFSPASRPDLTLSKEDAIRRLTQRVFKLSSFERRVFRKVDDLDFWGQPGQGRQELRTLFLKHRVTEPDEVGRWLEMLGELRRYADQGPPQDGDPTLARELIHRGLAEASADGEACVFLRATYEPLAREALPLLRLPGAWPAHLDLRFKSWSVERNRLRRELQLIEPVADFLQIGRFLDICDHHGLDRAARRATARTLERLWNDRLDPSLEWSELVTMGVKRVEELEPQSAADALREALGQLTDELALRIGEEEKPAQGWIERIQRKLWPRPADPARDELRRGHELLKGILKALQAPASEEQRSA